MAKRLKEILKKRLGAAPALHPPTRDLDADMVAMVAQSFLSQPLRALAAFPFSFWSTKDNLRCEINSSPSDGLKKKNREVFCTANVENAKAPYPLKVARFPLRTIFPSEISCRFRFFRF